MAGTVGPSTWWIRSKEAADYYARICPVGTILGDGSAVWCKAGGLSWIIAPDCVIVTSAWAGGKYNTTCVGLTIQICCVNEWPILCNKLISCGFNPCDWFVPDINVLKNYSLCLGRAIGDVWSSSELNSGNAYRTTTTGAGTQLGESKSSSLPVYAFRCITL